MKARKSRHCVVTTEQDLGQMKYLFDNYFMKTRPVGMVIAPWGCQEDDFMSDCNHMLHVECEQKLDDFMNFGVGLVLSRVCEVDTKSKTEKYEHVHEQKQHISCKKLTGCKVNDL